MFQNDMGTKSLVTRSQLAGDFARLGLVADDVVMVHSFVRAVGKVLGGPDVVIYALLDTIGSAGTVMMYVDWEDAVQHLTRNDTADGLDRRLLDEVPAFDPARSRARRAYGILPEFLRTWPGAHRSENPDASVAAVGAQAEWLCADHPLQYGYGPGSLLAKLVQVKGKVLLIGAPFETVTLLHHSEHVARLSNKRVIRYREPLLVDGARRWIDIEEFDTSRPIVPEASPEYFSSVVRDYVNASKGRSGEVGAAQSYLFDAAALHQYAVRWIESRWGT